MDKACRFALVESAKRQALSLLLQFDRPVSVVEEALPRLVLAVGQLQVQHRTALRLFRLADQVHVGLARRPAALPDVPGHPGTDDVLPGRLASLTARDDVVEAQL